MDQKGPAGGVMKLVEKISQWFAVPVLTRERVWFAFTVAVVTDTIQLLLVLLGWTFLDEILDVIAMGLTCAALGFHMLLLPTFVIELVPVALMLPTWTGCTAAVVMLRKRARAQAQPPPLPPPYILDPREVQVHPLPDSPAPPGQWEQPQRRPGPQGPNQER